MESVLQMREAETIYDYAWYPLMNSADPASCCLISSCRDHPLHMWDAFTGQLRCTYRAYDHLDEISAAHSLAFSADGAKLYTGHKNVVRVFDVSRPGRDNHQRKTTKGKDEALPLSLSLSLSVLVLVRWLCPTLC